MSIDADNPHAKPRTKRECLEMAQRWGHEWSHWNEHARLCHDEDDGSSRRSAFVTCAQHDAAEVARLGALYPMLPELIQP